MKRIIHYIGLDVHKNSIAVAIAVEDGGELRSTPLRSARPAFMKKGKT